MDFPISTRKSYFDVKYFRHFITIFSSIGISWTDKNPEIYDPTDWDYFFPKSWTSPDM